MIYGPVYPGAVRSILLALAVVLTLALWVMLPALSEADSTLVGDWMHPDCISNHWLLAWVAERLAAGEGILHNPRYYWPVGDAPVLAGNGAEGVAYLPFHVLLGWPTGAVVYLTVVLAFNGLAAWALGRALGAGPVHALLPAAATRRRRFVSICRIGKCCIVALDV